MILKLLHIFGVIVFLGNIIVTAWWKVMGDRTKNPVVISFAQRQVALTDRILMQSSVLLIAVTGSLSVELQDIAWSTFWIAWGYGFFILSGIIWGLFVIPARKKLDKIAVQLPEDGTIPDEYWRLERKWIILGILAVLPLLVTFYCMIFKPL